MRSGFFSSGGFWFGVEEEKKWFHAIRATRCVREKIAQNVAQLVFSRKTNAKPLPWKKVAKNMVYFCNFQTTGQST
jgi:hypothetical protein